MTSTATILRVTEKDFVPGPDKYKVPEDFGNNSHKYTIGHRYPSKETRGPGYENIGTTIGQAPRYSLSSRHEPGKKFVPPGPNYVPPQFGSDAPASTFHMRLNTSHENVVSPGPGKYDTSTKGGGRHWTMKARKFIDDAAPIGPGPGGYHPDYDAVLPSARKTQIGNVIHRKDETPGPGPGKYEVDRTLANHPASFHLRIEEKRRDWVPGPGKYEPEKHYTRDSPQYSLRSRIYAPEFTNKAGYENIPSSIGTGLKYSLSSRHAELAKPVTPGPNYMPPAFGSDAIKCSLSSRRAERRPPPGPGPGQYKIEAPNDAKKWTMKARNFPPDAKNDGPGVGKYMPNYERVLPSPRRNQILERFSEKKNQSTPGYYDIGSTIGSGPKITIGVKEKLRVTPGVG